MKLVLNNIGKINNAFVEVNGITIIAGKNNTGKSTISKSLFSTFNSFYNVESKIKNERKLAIDDILFKNFEEIDFDDLDIITDNLTSLAYKESLTDKEIETKVINELESHGYTIQVNNENSRVVENIISHLKISEKEILERIVEKTFENEFNGQINNVFSENIGRISLSIKDKTVEIEFADNQVLEVKGELNLKTEAIYIDDPFVLDGVGTRNYRYLYFRDKDHKTDLRDKLLFGKKDNNSSVVNEIVVNNKFNSIYNKISSVCDGTIVENKNKTFEYKVGGTEKKIKVKNLSTGLKTFITIKKLLENGYLEENGTIILDEPEIHLHPEWQLLFAELIVLLQKEFGMHVILNTHSPYFLQAIEVYSEKYKISDKCNFYFMHEIDGRIVVERMKESLEPIYRVLARPLQELENERERDD